jgi:type III restriction enzyme
MKTYWVPGVNHLGTHGRWPLAEFCDNDEIQADFAAKVEQHFQQMIETATGSAS